MATLHRQYSFALSLLQGKPYVELIIPGQESATLSEELRIKLEKCFASLREKLPMFNAPALLEAISTIESAMDELHHENTQAALVLFAQAEKQIQKSHCPNNDAQLAATRMQLLCLFHRLEFFSDHCEMVSLGDAVHKVFSALTSLPSFKNALIDATTVQGKFKANKPSKLNKRTQEMMYIMTQVLNLRSLLTSVTNRSYDIYTRDHNVLDVCRDVPMVPMVPMNYENMISVECILLADDRLYVSDERNVITVFDTVRMDILHTIQCPNLVTHLVVSDNFLYTTSGTDRVNITIYDTLTYTDVAVIVCNTRMLCDLVVSKNRIYISGGSRQGVIYVWDKLTHKPLPSLESGVDFVYGLHMCGDVLYSGWEGGIVVYNVGDVGLNDASTADSVTKIDSVPNASSGVIIGHMACSPQGRVHNVTCLVKCTNLLCASRGMFIDVFDVSGINTGATTPVVCPLLHTFTGHTTIISSLHVCNHTLYSSSLDTTVKVWNLNTTALSNTHNTLCTSFNHTCGIRTMAVEGCILYTASYDVVIVFIE